MVIALAALILFSIVIVFQRTEIVRWNEWHHLYLGVLLAGLGSLLHANWLTITGDVLAIDDSTQHFIQAAFYPAFQSPLHWLYAKLLWPLPIVQKVTGFLNKIF